MTSPVPTFTLGPDHVLRRVQRAALVAAAGGGALAALGAVLAPTEFLRAYLTAWVFWVGATLGCLAILMIKYVAGGAWGAVIRRLLESGARTLPLMALLFLPIALGLPRLYAWARPEALAHDVLLQHKSVYLNVPFFLARTVFYFAVWILFTRTLVRWSLREDAAPDPYVAHRLDLVSRGGLVALGLTMTFASIDWVMSLEPHWSSTIYGVIFMGGAVLTAFALVIPVVALLVRHGPLDGVVTASHFHDLGKMLLAFVMLWAYFQFSQFLIIWAGNLPEEIPWYLARLHGGWQWLALAIVAFHFALPFAVLLSRDVTRRAPRLALVAVMLVLFRLLANFWLVMPAFHPAALAVSWLDVAATAGVGGLWLWTFVRLLEDRPLVPLGDPSLPIEA